MENNTNLLQELKSLLPENKTYNSIYAALSRHYEKDSSYKTTKQNTNNDPLKKDQWRNRRVLQVIAKKVADGECTVENFFNKPMVFSALLEKAIKEFGSDILKSKKELAEEKKNGLAKAKPLTLTPNDKPKTTKQKIANTVEDTRIIDELRKAKDVTRIKTCDIAKSANLKPNAVSNLLGKNAQNKNPELKTLSAIAAALGKKITIVDANVVPASLSSIEGISAGNTLENVTLGELYRMIKAIVEAHKAPDSPSSASDV